MNRTRGKAARRLSRRRPAGAAPERRHAAGAAPDRRATRGPPHRLPSVVTFASRQATLPRVALVHDFLLDVRGAERVFLQLCAMWPTADIFTAVYDPDGTEGRFADRVVHSSFLQRVRPTARTFRALLPLYPSAIESFDLSGYDLVVSSSSAWAHAVRYPEDTVHVSYCHNPFRYAWNDRDSTLARRNPVTRRFLRTAFRRWRRWDWAAAQRTDALRGQLPDHAGADSHLLRPRGRHRPPAGRHLALLSGSGRRLLRRRLRADVPQADRRRHRGVQCAAPATGHRRRRAGGPGAAPQGRPDDPLHRPRIRCGGGSDAPGRAGARGHRRRGVRDRRGGEPGRRAARHRPRRRRCAGDGPRRRHRLLLVGRRRRTGHRRARVRRRRGRSRGVRAPGDPIRCQHASAAS